MKIPRNLGPSVFIVLLVFLESLFLSPWLQAPETDREVFRYIGMAMREGKIPYKDIFDHKPPLIYFICALTDFMGPWGLWFFNASALSICSLFIYRIIKKNNLFPALLTLILFILLIRYSPIIDGGGLTREITCYLVFLLLNRILFAKGEKKILLGIISGLIFFTQQNELLAVIPFLIYDLFSETEFHARIFISNTLKLLAGFCSVTLIFVFYFYFNHALFDFWKSAFEFNTRFYIHSEYTFKGRITEVVHILYRLGFVIPAILFIVLAGITFIQSGTKIRNSIVLLVCIFSMGMEAYSIALSGRNYSHYFLGFIPYFCLLPLLSAQMTVGQADQMVPGQADQMTPRHNRLKKYIQFTSGLILIFTMVIFSEPGKWIQLKNIYSGNAYYDEIPYKLLAEAANKPGQIYVFRMTKMLGMNVETHTTAPTRWIYTTMWDNYLDWDAAGTEFQNMLDDLKKYQTRFILDYSKSYPMKRKELQQKWDKFISEHYLKVKSLPDQENLMRGTLFIREACPAMNCNNYDR